MYEICPARDGEMYGAAANNNFEIIILKSHREGVLHRDAE